MKILATVLAILITTSASATQLWGNNWHINSANSNNTFQNLHSNDFTFLKNIGIVVPNNSIPIFMAPISITITDPAPKTGGLSPAQISN